MAVGKTTVRDSNFVAYKCSDASILPGVIVQIDTTNTTNTETVVKAATASSQIPVGITTTATDAADQEVTVQFGGICSCWVDGAAGAISEGQHIIATTAGQGIVIAAVGVPNQYPIGVALQPSAADNDYIPILINGPAAVNKGVA